VLIDNARPQPGPAGRLLRQYLRREARLAGAL